MGDDQQFVFAGQVTLKQFAAITRYLDRDVYWFVRIVGIFLMLMPLLPTISSGKVDPVNIFAAGLPAFVFFYLIPVLLPKRVLRRTGPIATMPAHYRIDAEGFYVASQWGDSLCRWPMFQRVEQRQGLLLLGVGNRRPVLVPVGQLPPDTQAALLSFVRAHIASPASAPPAGDALTVGPPAS